MNDINWINQIEQNRIHVCTTIWKCVVCCRILSWKWKWRASNAIWLTSKISSKKPRKYAYSHWKLIVNWFLNRFSLFFGLDAVHTCKSHDHDHLIEFIVAPVLFLHQFLCLSSAHFHRCRHFLIVFASVSVSLISSLSSLETFWYVHLSAKKKYRTCSFVTCLFLDIQI